MECCHDNHSPREACPLKGEFARMAAELRAKEEECQRMRVLLGDKIKQFNVCKKAE